MTDVYNVQEEIGCIKGEIKVLQTNDTYHSEGIRDLKAKYEKIVWFIMGLFTSAVALLINMVK